MNVVKQGKKVHIRHILAKTLCGQQISIDGVPEELAPIIARIQEFAEYVETDPKKIFTIRDHEMGRQLKLWSEIVIRDLALDTAGEPFSPVSRRKLNLGRVFDWVLSGEFRTSSSDFLTDFMDFLSRLSQGIQNIKTYTVPDQAWIRRLEQLCQDAQETVVY